MKQKKTARFEVRLEQETKDMLIEAIGQGKLSDLSRELLKKYLKKIHAK